MATLVLSTIGNALGGPLGGAIGALIGQSIDQELFSSTRRGPRVGDLSVQTSSYGTQIPRIYGTIRVAGTVVWSTDLVEHSQTAGAKGSPNVTYTYTVSFAVALSSRVSSSIGRIWADGKLLRGGAGDLKVSGKLRFYNGSEDQIIDPLIGSVEGIGNTPAYRGLALAVFEDLALADYGNRIPFLTFEVLADAAATTVGAVLSDASAGAISSQANESVIGYAAYGRTVRDAVEPLVDSYAVEIFDDGDVLRDGSSTVEIVGDEEFGNSADEQQAARLQREQAPARSLPTTLRLTYYDPARDYQTGQARAAVSEQSGTEAQQDLPATLSADDAKALAQQMIARAWSRRDKLTLRLPPKRLALEPGAKVVVPLTPSEWTVDQSTVDGFVLVAELYPSGTATAALSADGGRITPNRDVVAGPITLALLDVPNVLGLASNTPVLMLAATSPSSGWRSSPVEIAFVGQEIPAQTARGKSLLGQALGILPMRSSELIDVESSVDVQLIDSTQWLTSADDDGLAAWQNIAMIGREVIQFGQALPLGGGAFRLTRLLRGRGGTEWACGGHIAGEDFCLLQMDALQPIELPGWSIGAMLTATAATGAVASLQYAGEGVRPVSPVDLAGELQPSGDLFLSWIRRSRQGFAWVDGIDAPLGETVEQYRVTLSTAAASMEIAAGQPTCTVAAATLTSLGSGPVTVEVRQVGDFAASYAAQITINLS